MTSSLCFCRVLPPLEMLLSRLVLLLSRPPLLPAGLFPPLLPPLFPPLFSSFNSDGSYAGGAGPPEVPPGNDDATREEEGDDNEGNEGAVTAASPMSALAMWLSSGLDWPPGPSDSPA